MNELYKLVLAKAKNAVENEKENSLSAGTEKLISTALKLYHATRKERETVLDKKDNQEIESELVMLLGAEHLKYVGMQISEIVRQHNLHHSPDVCRKLFTYLSDVVDGWNCV